MNGRLIPRAVVFRIFMPSLIGCVSLFSSVAAFPASSCGSKDRSLVAFTFYLVEARALPQHEFDAALSEADSLSAGKTHAQYYDALIERAEQIKARGRTFSVEERVEHYAQINEHVAKIVAQDQYPLLMAKMDAIGRTGGALEAAEQAYNQGMSAIEQKMRLMILTNDGNREASRQVALTEFLDAHTRAGTTNSDSAKADALGQAEHYLALSATDLRINPALLFAAAKIASQCREYSRAYSYLKNYLSLATAEDSHYQEAIQLTPEYRRNAGASP